MGRGKHLKMGTKVWAKPECEGPSLYTCVGGMTEERQEGVPTNQSRKRPDKTHTRKAELGHGLARSRAGACALCS